MALLVTPCFLPSYNSLCPKPIQFNFQINFKSMPMGLDFELKISPSSSFSNFELQLARGTPSPFWSNETNSMFILTAKLTGFSREDIGITINGTGTRIEIGWGQPVQRMEITRWMYKKETETRRFKKIFRIPDGVVLDEIKATYNDEESILKIVMPKLVDGILGVGIEEVKEQDVGEDALESQDSEAEEIPEVTEGFETGRETKFVEDAANGVFEGANATPEPSPKREYLAETTQEETEKLKGDEMEHIDGVSNHYSESEKSEKLTTEIAEAPKRWDNGGIVDSEIIIPKVRSVKGIELDEGTSKGTANHQKEKGEPNSEAHNGSIATMTNKQPDIKIQSQAAVDRDTKVPDKPELSQPNGKIQAEHKIVEQQGNKETYRSAWESKEFETNNEPEYIASPYLQSPSEISIHWCKVRKKNCKACVPAAKHQNQNRLSLRALASSANINIFLHNMDAETEVNFILPLILPPNHGSMHPLPQTQIRISLCSFLLINPQMPNIHGHRKLTIPMLYLHPFCLFYSLFTILEANFEDVL